jgi:hypothetical protein
VKGICFIEISFTNFLTVIGSDLIIRQDRSKKIESCEQGEYYGN